VLAGLPPWLIATAIGLAVVLLALLLFVPAEGPIARFERFTAALHGTAFSGQAGRRRGAIESPPTDDPPGA